MATALGFGAISAASAPDTFDCPDSVKQPHGIGWYAAWIVLALVLYMASAARGQLMAVTYAPDGLYAAVDWFYRPVDAIFEAMPKHSAVRRYHDQWGMDRLIALIRRKVTADTGSDFEPAP